MADRGGRCQRAYLHVYPKRDLRVGVGTWVALQINTPSLVYYYFRCGFANTDVCGLSIGLRIILMNHCDKGVNGATCGFVDS